MARVIPSPAPCKTPVAARHLEATYEQLMGLIRRGKIAPPGKDSSGDYVWTDADRARAADGLKVDRRRRKAVPA